jgi:uncharacterized protein YciI
MLYAIISEDVADSLPLRKTARPDHIARLERLRDQGRLILAGPLPAVDSEDPGDAGFSGSLVVPSSNRCKPPVTGPTPTPMWPPASTRTSR